MILRSFSAALLAAHGVVGQPQFEAVRQDGSAIRFQVRTATNAIYVLDEARSLSAGWTETMIFNGTGAAVELTNELSGNVRFFRARELPAVLTEKPGSAVQTAFSLSNSPAQWNLEGELPEGLMFSNGVLSGTLSAAAAEKLATGRYTNVVHLSVPGVGEQLTRTSSAQLVQHVKLSFSRNIYPGRPGGPSLGEICIKCHGSGFPPDFSPDPATLINVKAGSGGACPSTWDYIVPGDTNRSLVYLKVVVPPCGDRMPQGGPYFNQTQIDRLARWINELAPGERD